MAIKYNYDKDTDYKALMNDAIAAGDYKAAAQYEQLRNAKIAGEGITQYQQTHDLGSVYDYEHFTNEELGKAYHARQAAYASGDWASANAFVNGMRGEHGYSGGDDGSKYIAIEPEPKKPQSFSYQAMTPYVNQYQSLIDELRGKILEQDPFSYDAESDPLYQQYRDSYTRGGQQAMRDTLGQVSARTGGLASSYAGSAAQQTYDGYMSALSAKIPELQQLAYQMYQDEGEKQRLNLEMIAALEREDYNRYQGLLSQYNTDRSLAYQQYTDQLAQYNADRSFAYNQYRDGVLDSRYDAQWQYQLDRDQLNDQRYDDETAWNRGIYQDETAYNQKQDQYQKDAQRAALLASSGDFSGYGELWGLSEEQTRRLAEDYARRQGLDEDQAARELADWYAQYGDFSRLGELGVDTGWLLQQRAAPASSGGGSYSSGGGGNGSGGGSSGSGGGGTGAGWSAVEAWAERYGADAAESYIAEHYKDLGYSSKSAALAGWQNHLLESGADAGTGGAPNYEGLYRAAAGSSNPENFIATQYGSYGMNSDKGLYDGYTAWAKDKGKLWTGGGGTVQNTLQNSGMIMRMMHLRKKEQEQGLTPGEQKELEDLNEAFLQMEK